MDRKYTQFTPEKKEKFLKSLRTWPNVSRAARLCGISRRTAYKHIDPGCSEYDEQFVIDWKDALEEGLDRHEEEMDRRAFRGVLKPVFYKGEKVGTIREYSDTLAIFLSKAYRPEKFRDRQAVELTGKDGGPIEQKTVTEVHFYIPDNGRDADSD